MTDHVKSLTGTDSSVQRRNAGRQMELLRRETGMIRNLKIATTSSGGCQIKDR